ncbi:MAG: EAL domain-containing protein, partial [Spirochaetales bacterium]|nr:EAL domain-containing protein [Spirochaetales bacterium]
LSFENSLSARSLARWEALLNAGFLVDILQNERLVSHFHPIWDLKSQTLFAHECLIRGQDAQGNLVSPGRLFSTAAQTEMTFNLDRQARQTALKTASTLEASTKLFINFVPTAIYDPVFCLESTVALARQLGIAPAQIVFEVIETEEVEDWKHLDEILLFYRKAGFLIALDDVGSGYSSLNRLVQVRPDIIKVDIAIVRGIDRDSIKQSVFRALMQICRESGIKLLAEGIETPSELAYVRDEGADLAQGFLWGPPVPELALNSFGEHSRRVGP